MLLGAEVKPKPISELAPLVERMTSQVLKGLITQHPAAYCKDTLLTIGCNHAIVGVILILTRQRLAH